MRTTLVHWILAACGRKISGKSLATDRSADRLSGVTEDAMFETDSKKDAQSSGRRKFLAASGAAVAGLAWLRFGRPGAAQAATAKTVKIAEFTNAGVETGEQTVPTIVKTEAEWKAQLPHDSFEVTRHADTEMAFSGPLLNEHGKGVFRCICCDTALFNSATKFESGTGWPSFYQ